MIEKYTFPVVLKHPERFQKEYIRGRKQKVDKNRQDNRGYFFVTTPFFIPERDIQDAQIVSLKAENPYSVDPSDWIVDDYPFRPFFTDKFTLRS